MGLHVGLVGAGRMGAIHAATLAGHPLVSRLSLTDPDRERAALLAAQHGAVEAESPESMVEGGVQALGRAGAGGRQQPHGEDDGEQADGQVDKEDPPPASPGGRSPGPAGLGPARAGPGYLLSQASSRMITKG